MAPPRGESGARLDTPAGRAAEAAFQQRKANEAAQAAMRVAQAEAEQGRAAAADAAVAAAAAAAQKAAPAVQQAVAAHAQQIQTGGSGAAPVPGGGGGGAAGETAAEKAQREYYENLDRDRETAKKSDRETAKKSDRESASSFLRGILTQYGMGSLAGNVEGLVNDWGTNTEVIAEKLRQTDAYKTRFKGLVQLRAKGITDIADEEQYLQAESAYRRVFREAGISNFLGEAGTQTEYDAIAKLVGDFSLSIDEVRDRVTDAQRIVAQTPQEVRDSFQRFYNVDPATLTAYVLDPTRTASEINRRANAAMIGGLGMQRGLEFGAGVAERVGTFLGGEGDLTSTQAEPILGEIADVQRATGRLAQLEKSTLSAEETALAQLDLDTGAKEKVKGLQSRERARFGGTGAFSSTALGGGSRI